MEGNRADESYESHLIDRMTEAERLAGLQEDVAKACDKWRMSPLLRKALVRSLPEIAAILNAPTSAHGVSVKIGEITDEMRAQRILPDMTFTMPLSPSFVVRPDPTIVVNGRKHRIDADAISYAAVVELAGKTGTPTVTWREKSGRGGVLAAGDGVLIEDGMIFNVAHTDSA